MFKKIFITLIIMISVSFTAKAENCSINLPNEFSKLSVIISTSCIKLNRVCRYFPNHSACGTGTIEEFPKIPETREVEKAMKAEVELNNELSKAATLLFPNLIPAAFESSPNSKNGSAKENLPKLVLSPEELKHYYLSMIQLDQLSRSEDHEIVRLMGFTSDYLNKKWVDLYAQRFINRIRYNNNVRDEMATAGLLTALSIYFHDMATKSNFVFSSQRMGLFRRLFPPIRYLHSMGIFLSMSTGTLVGLSQKLDFEDFAIPHSPVHLIHFDYSGQTNSAWNDNIAEALHEAQITFNDQIASASGMLGFLLSNSSSAEALLQKMKVLQKLQGLNKNVLRWSKFTVVSIVVGFIISEAIEEVLSQIDYAERLALVTDVLKQLKEKMLTSDIDSQDLHELQTSLNILELYYLNDSPYIISGHKKIIRLLNKVENTTDVLGFREDLASIIMGHDVESFGDSQKNSLNNFRRSLCFNLQINKRLERKRQDFFDNWHVRERQKRWWVSTLSSDVRKYNKQLNGFKSDLYELLKNYDITPKSDLAILFNRRIRSLNAEQTLANNLLNHVDHIEQYSLEYVGKEIDRVNELHLDGPTEHSSIWKGLECYGESIL